MHNELHKSVNDLGVAAFLMMNGFKVMGRRGKAIYFNVLKEDEQEFDRLQWEYLTSQYHQFDSCLMALKKMGEYMPARNKGD